MTQDPGVEEPLPPDAGATDIPLEDIDVDPESTLVTFHWHVKGGVQPVILVAPKRRPQGNWSHDGIVYGRSDPVH